MKKLIPLFLAASLLLTGCHSGIGDSSQNSDTSDVAVTTAATIVTDVTETTALTTENNSTKTEAVTSVNTEAASSDTTTTTSDNEKQSETAQLSEATKGGEEMKETYTTPVTEIIEFNEEDIITASGGIKNDKGGVDLPFQGLD